MRYSGRRCVYYIIFIIMCGDRRPDYSPKLARVLKLHPYYDINNIKNYNNNNVSAHALKTPKRDDNHTRVSRSGGIKYYTHDKWGSDPVWYTYSYYDVTQHTQHTDDITRPKVYIK